jgi:hypothetical protein
MKLLNVMWIQIIRLCVSDRRSLKALLRATLLVLGLRKLTLWEQMVKTWNKPAKKNYSFIEKRPSQSTYAEDHWGAGVIHSRGCL